MKFLIDECVATTLVATAQARNYEAFHVAYIGLNGTSDHAIAKMAIENDWIIVTRNPKDFRGKHPPKPGGLLSKEELHPGLICLNLPDANATEQNEAFEAVLDFVQGLPSLMNTVIELHEADASWAISRYEMPQISS